MERARKYSCCRSKGLLSEYITLKDRWNYISTTLEYPDILPEISRRSALDKDVKLYSRRGSARDCARPRGSRRLRQTLCSRQTDLHDSRKATRKLAHILTLMKTAFYQRTDAIDVPYVIANIPFSPERSWGNELYLVAADNLVKNYLSLLDMHEKEWDRFVSYAPFRHRQLSNDFPGGIQTSFIHSYHVELSEDAKYNLKSFAFLAHEIGHAACSARIRKIKETEIVTPIYRFLWIFYNLAQRVSGYLQECSSEKNLGISRCTLQKLSSYFETDKNGKPIHSRKNFVVGIADSPFLRWIDQVFADVIAMNIAGPYYLPALVDYIYDAIVLVNQREKIVQLNNSTLFDLILRVSSCKAYAACALPQEFREESAKTAKQALRETKMAIAEVRKKKLARPKDLLSFDHCVGCITALGKDIGICLGEFHERILHDIIVSNEAVFETDQNLMLNLSNSKIVTNSEPRKVLSAYLKLFGSTEDSTCPSALYSMAHWAGRRSR